MPSNLYIFLLLTNDDISGKVLFCPRDLRKRGDLVATTVRTRGTVSDEAMHRLLELIGPRLTLYRRLGFRPREAVAVSCLHLEPDDKRRAVDALVRLGWVRADGDSGPDDVLADLLDSGRGE